MCGIGARFSIRPVNNQDVTHTQNGGTTTDLHYLLQYGNVQSVSEQQMDENNLTENKTESGDNGAEGADENDDGRDESLQEQLEKIKNTGNQSLPVSVDENPSYAKIVERIEEAISRRGPDSTNHQTITCDGVDVTLVASLLALRGDKPFPQPVSLGEHILIWNGEIFGNEYFRECVIEHGNDTICLLSHLSECADETQVLNTLANIEGPFGFVYVNTRENYLLFGRDILGRRSLLYCVNDEGTDLIISSVACHVPGFSQWRSIGVNGIFKLSLKPTTNLLNSIDLIEWNEIYKRTNKSPLISDRQCIEPKEEDLIVNSEKYEEIVDNFISHLSSSVKKRVTNIYDHDSTTKVCVLFSGGIDSVIITALTHLQLEQEDTAIDLLNVSFGANQQQQNQSADRKQSIEAWEELCKLYPTRKFRLVLVDVPTPELEENRLRIEKLIYPQNTVIDFNIGSALWFASER